MMKSGKQYKFGDILICQVQFMDTEEIKTRPVYVLFQEFDSVVVIGITSNPHVVGVPLSKEEGMIKDSIIKLNYIMTISEKMVKKYVCSATEEKKRIVKNELLKRIA